MPLTHEEKIKEARRKAEEMKAKAAAKRAAKAACATSAPPCEASNQQDEAFVLGDHNLILIDWDDTLFPTSAWKDRIQEGHAQPPRASKVQALSESIVEFVRKLKQYGDVKLVTHGTKGWYDRSSQVLLPEAKALLDSLDHRYRDSCGGKYMRKRPAGERYTTNIGVEVDHHGEWYKCDMFFGFITEKRTARKWDETHLPERVTLPRQVLIIGDGQAEKRSYDEHGNQAAIYASRPGHGAVASVGLKGVFLKDGPSYDELVLQQRWATAHVASTFLPADDFRTCMWDLTGFPTWTCSLKKGANAYMPISTGSLINDVPAPPPQPTAAITTEDEQLQMAIAMSIAQQQPPVQPPQQQVVGGAASTDVAAAAAPPAEPLAGGGESAADDEEERALQEALALSLS